jgi:hypothetical protein
VKVPFDGDAGMRTSALAQPGIFLQSPWPFGGAKHTVTSVGCADGSQVLGFRVALTALAPPGKPADSSIGDAVANAVTPLQPPESEITKIADANIDRRPVIFAV